MAGYPAKFNCNLCRRGFARKQGLRLHEQGRPHLEQLIDLESATAINQHFVVPNGAGAVGLHQPILPPAAQSAGISALGPQAVDPSPFNSLGQGGLEHEVPANEAGSHIAPAPQHLVTASARRTATHLVYQQGTAVLPLPTSVAPLPALLCKLSGDDRNILLKVLTHPDFCAQDIPWKSADQLHTFLDKYQANGMCLESQPMFDENNQRIYIDFESGKWLEESCETLKPCLDAGKTRMGYISPADTTCIGQRLGGHPQLLKLFQMAMAKDLTSPNAVLPAHINDYPRTFVTLFRSEYLMAWVLLTSCIVALPGKESWCMPTGLDAVTLSVSSKTTG
ncbi:TPA: hypothetical protein ACH3X1_016459 [Trebouxia sp. C0004]